MGPARASVGAACPASPSPDSPSALQRPGILIINSNHTTTFSTTKNSHNSYTTRNNHKLNSNNNHRLPNGVRTNVFFAEVPQYTIIMT